MLYTYKCEKCGWAGDKITTIAERDNQKCARQRPTGIIISERSLPTGHIDQKEDLELCAGQLVREEIAVTAFTPFAWKV